MSQRKPTVPIAERLLLTPAEAAGLLGVDYHRVLQWITLGPERGGIAAIAVGTQHRITRAALERWLASQEGAPRD